MVKCQVNFFNSNWAVKHYVMIKKTSLQCRLNLKQTHQYYFPRNILKQPRNILKRSAQFSTTRDISEILEPSITRFMPRVLGDQFLKCCGLFEWNISSRYCIALHFSLFSALGKILKKLSRTFFSLDVCEAEGEQQTALHSQKGSDS